MKDVISRFPNTKRRLTLNFEHNSYVCSFSFLWKHCRKIKLPRSCLQPVPRHINEILSAYIQYDWTAHLPYLDSFGYIFLSSFHAPPCLLFVEINQKREQKWRPDTLSIELVTECPEARPITKGFPP